LLPPLFLKVHGHMHTASVNCRLTRQAMAISNLASWSSVSTVCKHTPLRTGSISLFEVSHDIDTTKELRLVAEEERAVLRAVKEEGKANTCMVEGMALMAEVMGPAAP